MATYSVKEELSYNLNSSFGYVWQSKTRQFKSVGKAVTLSGLWVKVLADAVGNQTYYPRIRDINDVLLAAGAGVVPSAAGWVYLPFDAKVTLSADTIYHAQLYFSTYGGTNQMAYASDIADRNVASVPAGYTFFLGLCRYASTDSALGNGDSFEYPIGFEIFENAAPYAPVPYNISSQGSTINPKPKFFFAVSDPDSGNTFTDFQIQIGSDPTLSTVNYWNAVVGDPLGTFTGIPSAGNWNQTVTAQVNGSGAGLPPGTWYMRARVKDSAGTWSGWSAIQAFTVAAAPWADTIPNGPVRFKAEWLNQLATVINNARQFRGLVTFAFTDGTITANNTNQKQKALHITERRTKLADVLSLVGITPTWTDAALTTGATKRKGEHIKDLRSYAAQT